MGYSPITSVVSTANSSTSVLAGGAVFTGTSEDILNYNSVWINVFASHASATDGLSIQQSSNGTNWDHTDVFTIAATTGKVFHFPRHARYIRIVYTNGATLQTSFRLQTIFSTNPIKASAQRTADAYTNETDLEQIQTFTMFYNGTTWDRLRGDITNGLDVDVTRIIPGTAATNLGKARDGASASTDTGVSALLIRRDTPTTLTPIAGDYEVPQIDSMGAQWVREKSSTVSAVTSVASSASNVTILALNAQRRGATICNDSTAVLYLKLGATASTTSFTVKMLADAYYEVPAQYTGIIDGIWASANGSARVTEITS